MTDLPLDNHNYLLFAAKAYVNPNCFDDGEFQDDLKRVKYLKRLIRQHLDGQELKTRLILNHVIAWFNVFEPLAGSRILAFKLQEYWPQIFPFMEMCGFLPRNIVLGINNKVVDTDLVPRDERVVEALREL